MKTAFSARELAEMRLPGLPTTAQNIMARADREAWATVARPGRGGGRLVPVEALPIAAREELARRALAEAQPTVPAVPEKQTAALTASQRRTMEARAALCAEAQRLVPIAGGIMLAEAMLAAHAAAGTLAPQLAELVPLANARRNAGRSLSAKSLRRWRTELAAGGITALAPEPTAKKKAPAPWVAPLLAIWRRPGKPSLPSCIELLPEGIARPNLRTAQRVIAELGAIERNRGRMGPRDLKTIRPFKARDVSDILPGDIYTADGHCADFEVQHPDHGGPFRPEIICVLDIATRRCVGWSAGIAEATSLVADALRNAVETSGIPAIFYTDRGSGFKNAAMDAPAIGLMARLGVRRTESLPYNSQARGVIERFHQSCWVRSGRHLPTFVGADMDREAAQIVHKATRRDPSSPFIMGWPAFLRWAQAQIDAYNDRASRGGIAVRDPETGARRSRSPNEAWAATIAAAELPRPTPDEAADLFRPYVQRVVSRGTVSFRNASYFHRDLDALDLHGRNVLVGYDIHDAGRVWVRDLDERLICIAEVDANKTPYMPVSVIEQARADRAKGRLARLERHATEIRAERDGGELIELRPTPPTPEVARVLAEIQAPPKPAAPAPETAEDRYRRWAALDARIQAGEAVSAAEARWHRGYGQTAECDTERLMATVRAEFAARTETRKK